MTFSRAHRRNTFVCALIWALATGPGADANEQLKPIAVPIYSAEPTGVTHKAARQKVRVTRREDIIELGNGFLTAEISARSGTLRSIHNHLTDQKHVLIGDVVGLTVLGASGPRDWSAVDAHPRQFQIRTETAGEGDEAQVVLEDSSTDATVRLIYTLSAHDFWLQRRLIVRPTSKRCTIDRLVYGSLNIEGGQRRVLELGKFDRPSIVQSGRGGLFAGVAHWFYRTDDAGRYLNGDMAWEQAGEFESEPWYLGVFVEEAGEPYAGWSWYRAYLQRSKAAMAKQDAWFSWNAGWGQWGIDIDDHEAGPYLELMHRLGINGVIFGSGGFGKGIGKFNELAASDPTTKANVAALKRLGIAGGTLNNGSKPWDDAKKLPTLLAELDRHVAAGFRVTAFDFFESQDTYAAHRRVADYFRTAHAKLDYTECHLGMAAYGPQFQRMVRVNHPDDIAGFDISHFSANWATFLAFRHSRRKWQQKYQYLMPEDGLYYYLTHYANWGNPRRYTDPEPQQFVWRVPAYCGIGFNFHDVFGWRESIAAASAFTTCPVFGHIDLKMPDRDLQYARRFFAWIRENAAVLRPARVCAETEAYCVLSKIRNGRGVIYVLNYQPGARRFELSLKTGHAGPLSVRQIYPSLEPAREMADGQVLAVQVRGESTAIFEVNAALRSLPPENRSRFPIDLALETTRETWTARFNMPDVSDELAQSRDPALPRALLSLDQVQDSRPDLLVSIQADPERRIPAVKWLGKGKLPQPFLDVYPFDDGGQTVQTWKIAPWALADRVWLVVRPGAPVPLAGPHPTLTVNGVSLELVPRVDHRFDEVVKWNCPLYHADITGAVRFGDTNALSISIAGHAGQGGNPIAYVTSAADRN